jgi:hypothetical protein
MKIIQKNISRFIYGVWFGIFLCGSCGIAQGGSDSSDSLQISVTVKPDRLLYIEGEDIFIQYDISSSKPIQNSIDRCLRIESLDSVGVTHMFMFGGEPGESNRHFNGIYSANGEFWTSQPDSFIFQHLAPGRYQCGYACKANVMVSQFKIDPVPDSLREEWARYRNIKSRKTSLWYSKSRAALDSVLDDLKLSCDRPAESTWRMEELTEGLGTISSSRARLLSSKDRIVVARCICAYMDESRSFPWQAIGFAGSTIFRHLDGANLIREMRIFGKSTANPALITAIEQAIHDNSGILKGMRIEVH